VLYLARNYYFKLLMTYLLFLILAAVLLYTITVYYILPAMEDQVLGSNMKILQQLRDDFDYRYNKIDGATLFIYGLEQNSQIQLQNSSELLGMLYAAKKGGTVDKYEMQKAWENLYTYIGWSLDDLDSMVLVPSKGGVLTYAKFQTVDLSYDFSRKQWLRDIQESGSRKIKMLGGESPHDYYTGGKSGIITFARNIFIPDNPYEKEPLGTILINISNTMFANMIDVYNSNNIKDFIVLDRNGYIYFCRDSRLFGEKLPGYDAIKPDLSDESGHFEYTAGGQSDFYCYFKSEATGACFIAVIPKATLYSDVNMIKNYVLLITTFFLLVGVAVAYFSSRSRYKPIKLLLQSMKKVEEGDLDTRLDYAAKDETGIIINGFNNMVARLRDYINEVYVSEIKKKEAMFCALKSQVDAHFLCNVVEAIRSRALENSDMETAEVAKLLGRFYRERLGISEDLITIASEIEIVRTYTRIEEYRRNCKIHFKVDFPEGRLDDLIPKFTFQPIVENAINHGCRGMRTIEIDVSAFRTEGVLTILIADNGIGIGEDRLAEITSELDAAPDFTSNEHVGLRNINSRLKLYFGEAFGIRLASSGRGTTVFITIPSGGGEL
jgi:sensor histidine kinase YesM